MESISNPIHTFRCGNSAMYVPKIETYLDIWNKSSYITVVEGVSKE